MRSGDFRLRQYPIPFATAGDLGDPRNMAKKRRPRDFNQLAKRLVGIATGEDPEAGETPRTRRAAKAGRAGGPARAAKLTPEQRSEIARIAAAARWKKGR